MAGPLGFPWSTFAAVLVIAASIVIALVFAATRPSGKGDRDE
jgi:hypothetical protein